jgi:leucyl/phenylalanyl-tRNA---protein transferase
VDVGGRAAVNLDRSDLGRRFARRRPPEQDDAGVTDPPRQVPPSAWLLPDPHDADDDGVVGVGADLAASTLVDAYRRGIFPWPHPGVPLPWFSPDPRGVIHLGDFHLSRSLRRRLRTSGWETTVDTAFAAVLGGCSERPADVGTWITSPMARAYQRLHELGWAHSLEVWDGERLVGGVYGVQAGGVFTGESMFHREADASKVALADLCRRLHEAGGRLLDVQLTTPHLRTLGAVDLPRERFTRLLADARELDARLSTRRLPVARLLEGTAPTTVPGGPAVLGGPTTVRGGTVAPSAPGEAH